MVKDQRVKVMVSKMKGLARRNAHVKYESTYQSKLITKVKVCWRTDRQIIIGHPP
jgi:hypothetical protein